ncbi:hypothetical protein [Acinetobacter sp. ANC 4862]|uniref:hypothetical protein n=1 Tax=Acinetobacter sp. ANC 4862 TaxID=2529849 RepID=UPI00103A2914|nr:hypothetical protein [Acinetobacter sp. ANC 4862]TCH63254.1 hypothetical protein E0409_10715 [Acinetobacter sp. ANC 4862]
MSEIETNGYLTCSKCNSTNRVIEIGRQGIYKCGTCRNDLLVINKEQKDSKIISILTASVFIGVVGAFGIDQIQERLKSSNISYTELNTNWSDWQIEVFDRNCKANYSKLKSNWSSEKIAKTCTCFVTYIVERTDYPRTGKLSDVIVNESYRECR